MGQKATDPESYVEYYTQYVTSALSHPSVIGYNKCQYQDELLAQQDEYDTGQSQ